ncbi:MAG TPA: hypothetical protein VJ905_02645 [Halalkalibaculum sp.]|nr:hypothetical protein [Halalkalibaculum sp.]
MKHIESNKKGIGLMLLSLALFFGCNVNDSVTEDKNVKVKLRGKVFNGETGEEVPNAVITIYESVQTGDDDFRDYERATATTDHYGNYHMEGIIRSCNLEEVGGRIKAVKADLSGGFMTYTGEFRCSESLQTRNLIIRRTGNLPGLIIR